jgi:hypothetical protein
MRCDCGAEWLESWVRRDDYFAFLFPSWVSFRALSEGLGAGTDNRLSAPRSPPDCVTGLG